MVTLIIGIIIQDIIVIIVKSMEMFLRIVLEHTSKLTTKGAWVKPHVLAIWRLVISVGIFQQSQRHKVVKLIKEKARQMLNTSEKRWIRHGERKMIVAHQMEKGSLHSMVQVKWSHLIKLGNQ